MPPKIEGSLYLKPDFSTLREASWAQQQAIIFCDIPEFPLAPRNIVRKLPQQTETNLSISFTLSKNEPMDFTGSTSGEASLDMTEAHADILGAIKSTLAKSGIPVRYMRTGNGTATLDLFSFKSGVDLADACHLAQFLIRNTCQYEKYTVGFGESTEIKYLETGDLGGDKEKLVHPWPRPSRGSTTGSGIT